MSIAAKVCMRSAVSYCESNLESTIHDSLHRERPGSSALMRRGCTCAPDKPKRPPLSHQPAPHSIGGPLCRLEAALHLPSNIVAQFIAFVAQSDACLVCQAEPVMPLADSILHPLDGAADGLGVDRPRRQPRSRSGPSWRPCESRARLPASSNGISSESVANASRAARAGLRTGFLRPRCVCQAAANAVASPSIFSRRFLICRVSSTAFLSRACFNHDQAVRPAARERSLSRA